MRNQTTARPGNHAEITPHQADLLRVAELHHEDDTTGAGAAALLRVMIHHLSDGTDWSGTHLRETITPALRGISTLVELDVRNRDQTTPTHE